MRACREGPARHRCPSGQALCWMVEPKISHATWLADQRLITSSAVRKSSPKDVGMSMSACDGQKHFLWKNVCRFARMHRGDLAKNTTGSGAAPAGDQARMQSSSYRCVFGRGDTIIFSSNFSRRQAVVLKWAASLLRTFSAHPPVRSCNIQQKALQPFGAPLAVRSGKLCRSPNLSLQ